MFFADLKRKFNFTLKTMFTNIFLNIKLLLKKEKLKIILFISNYAHFAQIYIFLTKMHKLNKRKIKFQHQTISFLTTFKYIYFA